MSRVTTKVTDLASLRRAKSELEAHLESKKVSIQVNVQNLKNNFTPLKDLLISSGNSENLSDFPSKLMVKFIVKKLIKPKSKIISKASIFVGSFLIDKFGRDIQEKIAKWIIKKDQKEIDE